MTYIKHFMIMLRFMTIIPVKANIETEREDYGKSLAAAPLVGLVIGLAMAGANYVLTLILPALPAAVFTFAVYILLTGGLHLDGLGDTADGLFSNRPRERILEIMKDSRVGTNAVVTLILVILLDISLIASPAKFMPLILILMPVAGRVGSLVGAGISSYAGISDGPGRWCVEYCRGREIVKGLTTQILIFALVLITGILTNIMIPSWLLLPFIILPPVSAMILTKLLGRKLGGVTGDILGAVCELNQVVFLLMSVVLMKLF